MFTGKTQEFASAFSQELILSLFSFSFPAESLHFTFFKFLFLLYSVEIDDEDPMIFLKESS